MEGVSYCTFKKINCYNIVNYLNQLNPSLITFPLSYIDYKLNEETWKIFN